MPTTKTIRSAGIGTVRSTQSRRRPLAILFPAVVGAVIAAVPGHAAAQSALGVPYIGSNQLSFYTTELATDGIGSQTSTLFGARYGRQFGRVAAQSHFAVNAQLAARPLEGATDGLVDLSMTTSWSRRMDEITPRLGVAISAGGSVLGWGLGDDSIGIARLSLPATVGVSYDVSIGGMTFSPFVAPGVAYVRSRHYINDERVGGDDGWDARMTSGASLRLKDVVLTASTIRGENGLPNRSRWAFAAGISF